MLARHYGVENLTDDGLCSSDLSAQVINSGLQVSRINGDIAWLVQLKGAWCCGLAEVRAVTEFMLEFTG